jgi:Tfp pilus assembly protein PilF
MPSELNTIWSEARVHIQERQFDKAVEIYKYILIRYGDDPAVHEQAHAHLSDVYLAANKVGLAEFHINKAIRDNPKKAAYRYLRGFIYSRQWRWKESICEFEMAVKQEPNHGEFHRGLGWAVYSSGDTLNGLVILHKAHELEPDNTNTLTDLGLGDFARARKYIKMALDIDPGNPLTMGAYWNIHYLLQQAHMDEEE